MLTHTSGIYDYYDEDIEQDYEHFTVEIPWCELETPSDYYPLFQGKAKKFRPGERYSYSNGGYVFLGTLIEKLTGMLYRDFVREHVLQAANMHRSGFYVFNDLPENTANGYLKDKRITNIYELPFRDGGHSGMYTTTDDLRSFWDSLFSNGILSKELTEVYLGTYRTFDETYGHGCGIYKRIVIGDPSQRRAVVGEHGEGTEDYPGVCFLGTGRLLELGRQYDVDLALVYHPQVSYDSVVKGASSGWLRRSARRSTD